MSEDRRKEIWFDNVHFTAAGYDLLGSLLAERIWQLISEFTVPIQPTTQASLSS
jgi:hypothetical protein